MPATGWEFKQQLDGSGSVRQNSTRLPAAALKGAVSPQTTATVTPSAVDTVRTQFLSEIDTNRAAILLVSSAPLNSFSRSRDSPGKSGVGVFWPRWSPWGGCRARVGTLEMRGRAGNGFSPCWLERDPGMEKRISESEVEMEGWGLIPGVPSQGLHAEWPQVMWGLLLCLSLLRRKKHFTDGVGANPGAWGQGEPPGMAHPRLDPA